MQISSNSTNTYSHAGFHAQTMVAQIVQKQLMEQSNESDLKKKNEGLLHNDDFLKGDSFYCKSSF